MEKRKCCPISFCNYFNVIFTFSLRVAAILDHFGYPTPSLTEWQQHIWYDLDAIHSCVYEMRHRLAMGRAPQPHSVSSTVSATPSASSVQSHPRVGRKMPRAPPEPAPAAPSVDQPAETSLQPSPAKGKEKRKRGKGRRMMLAHQGPRNTRKEHPPWLLQIQRSTRTRW